MKSTERQDRVAHDKRITSTVHPLGSIHRLVSPLTVGYLQDPARITNSSSKYTAPPEEHYYNKYSRRDRHRLKQIRGRWCNTSTVDYMFLFLDFCLMIPLVFSSFFTEYLLQHSLHVYGTIATTFARYAAYSAFVRVR